MIRTLIRPPPGAQRGGLRASAPSPSTRGPDPNPPRSPRRPACNTSDRPRTKSGSRWPYPNCRSARGTRRPRHKDRERSPRGRGGSPSPAAAARHSPFRRGTWLRTHRGKLSRERVPPPPGRRDAGRGCIAPHSCIAGLGRFRTGRPSRDRSDRGPRACCAQLSPSRPPTTPAGTAPSRGGSFPKASSPRSGTTLPETERFRRELLADEKERAEHNMLVDLGRNDLGKVCRFGSIRVPQYMSVERYSHVQHLVSRVEGELAPGRDSLDAFEAMLPAGTVSGAPKPRAMEILHALEGTEI